MKTQVYRNHTGVTLVKEHQETRRVSALKAENMIPGVIAGTYSKRSGSKVFAHDGDVFGLGSYQDLSIARLVTVERIIRLTSQGLSVSAEKLNYSTGQFENMTINGVTFDPSRIAMFCQQNEMLIIAGGSVGKLTSADGDIEPLGGSRPSSAPTITYSSSGITGTYSYAISFYDSISGWESSRSDSVTASPSNQKVILHDIPTTSDRPGVDQIRIYRTISTGEEPFLYRGETNLGGTTFTDYADDSQLSAIVAPEDHGPPPSDAWIVASYADRIFIAQENKLYYSLPYDGTIQPLEYFSEDRVERFPQRITGLHYSPAIDRLLVFTPPGYGIYEISGRTETEFSKGLYLGRMGTRFAHSIASDGVNITFWGANGPELLKPGGIDEDYNAALMGLADSIAMEEYDTSMFVWSVYSSSLRQFVYGLAAISGQQGFWLDIGTELKQNWYDADTLEQVSWDDV